MQPITPSVELKNELEKTRDQLNICLDTIDKYRGHDSSLKSRLIESRNKIIRTLCEFK